MIIILKWLLFLGGWLQVPSAMAPNIEIRFTRERFVLEQASLLLGRPSLLTAGTQPLEIVNGSVKVLIGSPGLVEGGLFGPRIRPLSGQETILLAWAEFRRQVTEEEWRSGVLTINMDTLRQVAIRVEDERGRKVADARIGLAGAQREGGMDLKVDKNGEVKLLLPPGTYRAGAPGGARVQFQVTSGDGEQIVVVPTGIPPEPKD